MKKLFLYSLPFLIGSCATAKLPVDLLYVADLTNGVCAEYKIIDQTTFKVRLNRELPLYKGGPCDRMVGFAYGDFKKVQNFIRDKIKECK